MKFPFLISLPHCSRQIPEDVRPSLALTDEEILESTDIGTEEIFRSIPAGKVLFARWSRLLVDLNRGPGKGGKKGVIAQVDYHGRTIYRADRIPDEQEEERRIKEYYLPFHKRLIKEFEHPDIKVLFDCHSLNGIGPAEAPDAGRKRKDITLSNNGDHDGNSDPARGSITCPTKRLLLMKDAFQKAGFSVSVNDPYAGGFITIHYGQKYAHTGKFSVQIEINQDLYLKPNSMQPVTERLDEVRGRVLQAFLKIASKL